MTNRRPLPRQARAALASAFVLFATLQAGLSLYIDRCRPQIRDPEYGYKLQLLRARLREDPGRSLWLFLGSSRTAVGFRPEALTPEPSAAAARPLLFNFGLTGSGPLLEWLTLRRLLADGIRPDHVVIEILPPILHQHTRRGEADWINVCRLRRDDLPTLADYAGEPGFRSRRWLISRLTPCYTHRFAIMSEYAGSWLTWQARLDNWKGLDRTGWLPYYRSEVNDEQHRRAVAHAQREYGPALDRYEISVPTGRALRQVLELCAREHLPATLLLMPEGAMFRSWYPAQAPGLIDAYVRSLQQDYGAPVVDTRTWMSEDDFFDSHHLLPPAAAVFTGRLVPEVLRTGRPAAGPVTGRTEKGTGGA